MAPRRVKVNKFDYKKLTANDVICPVCRSILIKPITLPCTHGFCASCFETTTQNANLVCPLCRVRIGSWLRSATKSKKLINESFWQAIQDMFPLQVRSKLNGMDENFIEDKYMKAGNDNKREVSTKVNENLLRNDFPSALNINKFKSNTKIEKKLAEQLACSVPSASTTHLGKAAGLVNTISKNHNQTVSLNSQKNEKSSSILLNNFATKEYTCRILCQNVSTKDTQKHVNCESLTLIQKKHKRIQKITESELLNDRSNSIESECLYFKPIDYRHNPPSEGLAPIKVPTRKPNVSANIRILAPCGQTQINMNSLESAFARLFSPMLPEEKADTSKNENIHSKQTVLQDDTAVTSMKRKYEKPESKSKKKLKNTQKPIENQLGESKTEDTDIELTSLCDMNQCGASYVVENIKFSVNNSNNNIKKITNIEQLSRSLTDAEQTKRSLQEKADFELATKLQQKYNQSSKYSTRSTVLKRTAAKKQVKIEGIMTPYKVK